MTKIVDSNMGGVATKPEGDWIRSQEYKRFRQVRHNHDTWTSRHDGNKGNEPVDGSPHWFRNTDGGEHAWNEGEAAKDKGEMARIQAERAKAYADHQPIIIDGYWHIWDDSQKKYVSSHSALITGDSFTEEEKAEMLDRISSPHIIGSTLVFPSTGDARIVGSTLILTK